MLGYVYRIDFPDKFFYIGSTKNIYQRMRRHWHSKTYVSDKIKENDLSLEDLFNCITVLYEGDLYTYVEDSHLYMNSSDPYMLNIQRGFRWPIECTVEESIKNVLHESPEILSKMDIFKIISKSGSHMTFDRGCKNYLKKAYVKTYKALKKDK